jgi:CSLREA domain-containing protein
MRRSFRPQVDRLEDRLAPAVITVTTLADESASDGQVSLREAIQAAETHTSVDGSAAGTGNDTIVFAPAIAGGVVRLTQADATLFGPSALVITSQITIAGTGETITRASGVFRLFLVTPAGDLPCRTWPWATGWPRAGTGGRATAAAAAARQGWTAPSSTTGACWPWAASP